MTEFSVARASGRALLARALLRLTVRARSLRAFLVFRHPREFVLNLARPRCVFFADAFGAYAADNLIPARVSAAARLAELMTERDRGGIPARKLSEEELPAVGRRGRARPVDGTKAVIEVVLPRRTSFTRKEAFQRTVAQVVAANVDTVFVSPRSVRPQPEAARALPDVGRTRLDPGRRRQQERYRRRSDVELLEVEPVTMGVSVHAVSAVSSGAGAGRPRPVPATRPKSRSSARPESGSRRSCTASPDGKSWPRPRRAPAGAGGTPRVTASSSRSPRARCSSTRRGSRRAPALGGRGGPRHDVLGDQRPRGAVQVLRLLTPARAGLRDPAGA